MPTYDYECRNCSHRFEFFQSMSDDALTKCPDCGTENLRRLISVGSGIIFKGSGFYVNDSRDAQKKKGVSPEKGGESASSSKSVNSAPGKTGKTEPSKPATKT